MYATDRYCATLQEADDLTPLALLEEVCLVESRQDVSTKLVKIFLGQGLVIPFLDYLNFHEISRTSKCLHIPSFGPHNTQKMVRV